MRDIPYWGCLKDKLNSSNFNKIPQKLSTLWVFLKFSCWKFLNTFVLTNSLCPLGRVLPRLTGASPSCLRRGLDWDIKYNGCRSQRQIPIWYKYKYTKITNAMMDSRRHEGREKSGGYWNSICVDIFWQHNAYPNIRSHSNIFQMMIWDEILNQKKYKNLPLFLLSRSEALKPCCCWLVPACNM